MAVLTPDIVPASVLVTGKRLAWLRSPVPEQDRAKAPAGALISLDPLPSLATTLKLSEAL